jgi:hypothetical protein
MTTPRHKCNDVGVFLVFMWVPSLILISPTSPLPTGLVFSTFMLAMTIGGMLFSYVLPFVPGGPEVLCIAVYIISAIGQYWICFITTPCHSLVC